MLTRFALFTALFYNFLFTLHMPTAHAASGLKPFSRPIYLKTYEFQGITLKVGKNGRGLIQKPNTPDQEIILPTGQHLRDIWASSLNNIWVVGDNGTIFKYNGSRWERIDIHVGSVDLYGISGCTSQGQQTLYLVAKTGLIECKSNHCSWMTLPAGTNFDGQTAKISSTSPTNLSIQTGNKIFHFDRSARTTTVVHTSSK